MTNPPTKWAPTPNYESAITAFGWHMGMSLALAIQSGRTTHPDRQIDRLRKLGFQFAASDAKRFGVYPLFQQGAKEATKSVLHNEPKETNESQN